MKYGIKSIIRTKVKSTLYVLLIALPVLLLSLGFGMKNAADNMLLMADTIFSTIFEIVYDNGSDIENAEITENIKSAYRELQLEEFLQDEVISYEESLVHQVYVDGYKLKRKDMPNADFAVLTVNIIYRDSTYNAWCAQVLSADYSEHNVEGRIVYISDDTVTANGEGLSLGKYIFCGQFEVRLANAYMWFRLYDEEERNALYDHGVKNMSTENCVNREEFISSVSFDEMSEIDAFWLSSLGETFKQIMKAQKINNRSIPLVATRNLEGIPSFSMGESVLLEGELFNETKEGENVCLIPYRVASQMELSVGDKVRLWIHPADNSLEINEENLIEGEFVEEAEYTITGIYNNIEENSPIYIPYYGQTYLAHSEGDKTYLRGILDNRAAIAYEKRVAEDLPEDVHIYLYDQGYQASVMPINNMKQTATALIMASLIVAMLVLWLFLYMYINSNKENIKILVSLGAGNKRVLTYITSGCAAIAFLAVLLGAHLGYLLSDKLIVKVYQYMEENQVYDFRFNLRGYGIKS
ncbi:hypothetical protein LJC58_04850, partial [Lachnospiraceae bacterium OttesenSCG-928-D06]|nr:hypothetical protein [Lachnospiraceae bacterium OttesenSCG-928-D06]